MWKRIAKWVARQLVKAAAEEDVFKQQQKPGGPRPPASPLSKPKAPNEMPRRPDGSRF
jgi:hypothetical protein